jgi:hypothetical protein
MNTQSPILKWSLIVGIIIVLNLFFNYALSLVYERPNYEAFCPQMQVVTIPDNQNECVAKGGQWTDNAYYAKPISATPAGLEESRGYCDLQFTCRQGFEAATKTYGRNVFVVLVVLGALSVLAGNFFRGNTVVSGGLALAGVLSFIIASIRYWSSADNLARVIILAIALGLLFWIAMKKFNDRVRS